MLNLKLSYRVYVGIRLKDEIPRTATARHNRQRCGYDILLSSDFLVSTSHLVDLLTERWSSQRSAAHTPLGA